jgi:hypothetical protein
VFLGSYREAARCLSNVGGTRVARARKLVDSIFIEEGRLLFIYETENVLKLCSGFEKCFATCLTQGAFKLVGNAGDKWDDSIRS